MTDVIISGVGLVFIRVVMVAMMGLFSACAFDSKTIFPAQLESFSPVCHEDIEKGVQKLLGISHIKLSKDVFSKSAYLVLSNHPRFMLNHNDPLVGAKGSQNLLFLYRQDNQCYLGLLDQKKNIDTKVLLRQCSCYKVK